MLLQKRRDMLADGRFRRIRQTEFNHAAAFFVGPFIKAGQREKAVQRNPAHFVTAQHRRTGAADQLGAAAQQRHVDLFGSLFRQQPLLGDPALFDQLRQIGGGQALALADDAAFRQPRQGQVDIVAAQHQMVTDPDPGQFRFAQAMLDFDQGQIGGAAAHVQHQQQMHVRQCRPQPSRVAPQPVITHRLRLLQQTHVWQTGLPGRRQGQRAGGFVEGSGDGDDDVLIFQRRIGVTVPPYAADMLQITGAGLNRRHLNDPIVAAPGQDIGAVVHRRVRQPTFRAGHQTAFGLRP